MKVTELEFNIRVAGHQAAYGIKDLSRQLGSLIPNAKKGTSALGNFASSLKRIAYYRFIRSIIKAITQAFTEGTKNAYHFSEAVGYYISDALDTLATKNYTTTNQLGAAWATLLAALTPILTQILSLITAVANAITQFFSVLGGKDTYLKAIDYTKKWEDTTKSGAAAAKEWKNQLMGFDEINRLNEPSGGGGGGGAGTPDYSKMFEVTPVGGAISGIVDMIKANLFDLEMFASGMALGIGLILTMTGANVPLGLALIVLGAIGMAKAIEANWSDDLLTNIKTMLGGIMMAALGGLFGIGMILAFSGANVPLGLALMAGALIVAANIIALKWDEMPKRVKFVISAITAVVSLALFGVGAVLAFSGVNIPLGIGLMALGAVGIISAVKVSWDELPDTVQRKISAIEIAVSGALIAVGAILAFSGVGIPLGLGLMLAGIGLAGLGTASAVNWDELVSNFRSKLDEAGQAFERFKGKVQNAINKVVEFWNWLTGRSVSVSTPSAYTSPYSSVAQYASGGYPNQGQLFVAREAGPELVGQIGGRTAVASNNDIVASVSDGVYRAVTESLLTYGGNGNSNQDIVIQIDGNTIARATTKYQRFNTIAANA